MKRRVEFHSEDWSIQFWGTTSVLYLKLCKTLDGRFIVEKNGPVLPPWGHTVIPHQTVLEHTSEHKITRHRTERRWWIPYFMVWYITNDLDHKEIYIRDDPPDAAAAESPKVTPPTLPALAQAEQLH